MSYCAALTQDKGKCVSQVVTKKGEQKCRGGKLQKECFYYVRIVKIDESHAGENTNGKL